MEYPTLQFTLQAGIRHNIMPEILIVFTEAADDKSVVLFFLGGDDCIKIEIRNHRDLYDRIGHNSLY